MNDITLDFEWESRGTTNVSLAQLRAIFPNAPVSNDIPTWHQFLDNQPAKAFNALPKPTLDEYDEHIIAYRSFVLGHVTVTP